MPDSQRIKEIHAALEAQTYSKYVSEDDGSDKPRVSNIGYYTERIAQVLGVNVLADGISYSPIEPQRVSLTDQDDNNTIDVPAPYKISRWGVSVQDVTDEQLQTGVDEQGDPIIPDTDAPKTVPYNGLIYESVSNRFNIDPATGEKTTIEPTGLMLVHNYPQLIRQIIDDFDKALGLQESAAFAVRSAEDIVDEEGINALFPKYKPKICTYEGLHSLVTEISYMLSEVSRRSSGAQVSSMINNALLYEIMGIFGLPIEPKSFTAKVGLEESNGQDIKSQIYHPGFSDNAPRIYELWTILMQNIAPLLGANYTVSDSEKENIRSLSREELEQYIEQMKQEIRNNYGS